MKESIVIGVPYGSRTRVAAVKEKGPIVVQRNFEQAEMERAFLVSSEYSQGFCQDSRQSGNEVSTTSR